MAVTLKPPWGLLDGRLDQIWSAGQTQTASVPNPFLVAINGRPYLHDLEFKPWKRQAMRATTDSITRTQADTSNEPGEQSLSTESLWRRTQDSWHLGSGQIYLDRKNSQEYSFRQSKGVDVWNQWELTLLNDTTQYLNSSYNSSYMIAAGSNYVYHIDSGAGTVYYNPNGGVGSWTALTTGVPAQTASSICTDGVNIYIAFGSAGLYTCQIGATSMTQLVTSALSSTAVVRFVMGRLLVLNNQGIYNITSATPTTLPSPLMTSLYGSMKWTDATNGNGVIFVAGNSGNMGIIYSIQIQPDGTTLASPIVCGQLPAGETVNAIMGCFGSGVVIGTSQGVRFSEQALANGVAGTVSLTIGPVNLLPSPVVCFSQFGRFIYGNYTNFDSQSTGLFRMDPTNFVSDLAPAFASDLMATTQGNVTSVCVTGTGLVNFTVDGVGSFVQATTYVASGYIQSGFITYGLADDKMPVYVDLAMLPLPTGTSISTAISLDSGSFTTIGTANQAGTPFVEFGSPQYLSNTIEIQDTLYANTANTSTPTLTRHTLRSIPAAIAPTDWSIVIQLRERVRIKDVEYQLTPSVEYKYLDNLRITKQICNIQVGNIGPFYGTIEVIDWIPEQWSSLDGELNGVAVLTVRTLA